MLQTVGWAKLRNRAGLTKQALAPQKSYPRPITPSYCGPAFARDYGEWHVKSCICASDSPAKVSGPKIISACAGLYVYLVGIAKSLSMH